MLAHPHAYVPSPGLNAQPTSNPTDTPLAPAPAKLSASAMAEAAAAAVAGAPPPGKTQICFDFTKNLCSRGAACRFSHNLHHIITVNSQEKGVCFDFLKGLCSRGALCRFSHDLTNLNPALPEALAAVSS